MVEQVIGRIRVVVLQILSRYKPGCRHQLVVRLVYHWFCLLCIGSTILFDRKLREVVFLCLAFLVILPSLLQKRFGPLVRLTLRNLTICVRECPSFEMSKGQQSYFHLNGFLLTCELFKVDIKDVMMVV